ncbi:hypothetical protein HYFRA_00006809 [Hymenoscyphus fraxineus]|uniref:AB hydrolase-1 domain-containing protein n=1 Tax=Hymenoscyphus fraxineus TaxID=746836 RepID=A0A9N9PKU1_9HELO|nr:hypothetical protein HYFRA_00006809 [Hymenoscyphus fraxineus]
MDTKFLLSRKPPSASMSPKELDHHLPYSPDLLPGGRDVNSPYGRIRLYEWGPEEGKKVLFIHGLSTPAPALGTVADTLTQRGCRVMILDLWGRGYSDAPMDLKHDSRLYATQILLAISTSPTSWTGSKSGGFSLVGYSMGGGVVVSFAGYFPQLINSVVLMAPGGLYTSLPPEYHALHVRYSWIFPSKYVKYAIRKLLNGTTGAVSQDETTFPNSQSNYGIQASTKCSPRIVVSPEISLDVPAVVNWEIDNNRAFIHSVTSSIRHAPIENQFSAWSFLRTLIEENEGSKTVSGQPNRLSGTKVLLLVGNQDSILPKHQLCRNAQNALGSENVEIMGFNGGHDFPITHGVEVAETVSDFWKIQV